MNKILECIIDVIIAIVVIFLGVTIYFGLRTETTVKSMVVKIADDYITDTKKRGYFTLKDYENLYNKLSLTNAIYDVTLEHTYTIWEPEYRMKTLQEILDAQNGSYKGQNVYTYREVKTEVPIVSDPVNIGSLNTETNESVLARAINSPADPNHIHSDDCNAAHVHTGACHKIIIEQWSTSDATLIYDFHCTNCNTTIARFWVGYDVLNYGAYTTTTVYGYHLSYFSSNGSNLSDTATEVSSRTHDFAMTYVSPGGDFVTKYNIDLATEFSKLKNYVETHTDHIERENLGPVAFRYHYFTAPVYASDFPIPYYNNPGTSSWSKGYEYVDGCPGCGAAICSNIGTLKCNEVVVSITATHPIQTVYIGDNIISTAVATYLDGSKRTMICTASGYDKDKLGLQNVTLSYTGLIDNAKTTGTKACMIKITVIPKTKTCSNGHVYNLNTDGSDPGCPYCKEWIKNLQFIYPLSNNITITIGTTLQDNGIKLLATYMDGHTQILIDQYVDNLDTKYLGTMIVTVGYKGATAQLRVTTECAIITCPICKNTYRLYPDGSDPGCPYCIAKIPVFTGNILNYDETVTTNEILEILYQKSIYEFNKDDIFTIEIKNKSSSIARKILNKFYPSLTKEWINLKKSTRISSNDEYEY